MSSSNCCVLTQIKVSQETCKVVWYSHLFKNFPVCYDPHSQRLHHSQWSRSRCFCENPMLCPYPMNVGNLISGSSAFFKSILSIWKFTVRILLKSGLENLGHYFACVWDEYNCAVVWALFGIAFLWDWNKNWPFPVLWPLMSFPNVLAYWVQHFTASSFRIWKSSTGIPSRPLALFVVMLPKAHLTLHSRMSGSKWVITPSWLSGSIWSFFE